MTRSGVLTRRALLRLAGAAAIATPLSACQIIEAVVSARPRGGGSAVPATPPATAIRIAYPKLEYHAQLRNRLLNAARKVDPAFGFTFQILPVGLSIGLPEEQALDLPPPMPEVPRVYADRLKTDTFRSDLAVVDPVTIGALAAKDVLHDLTILLEGQRWFDRADYLGDALAAATIGGKLLALPVEVALEAIWWNQPAFAARDVAPPRPDWNWEGFLRAATGLTVPDARPSWGCVISTAAPSIWSLAWQQGAEPARASGAIVLDEPGTHRAAAFLSDLIHLQRVAPPIDTAPPDENAYPIARVHSIVPRGSRRGFPVGVAMMGDFVGGPFWSRPGQDAALAPLPVSGEPAYLGVALLMLAVPRHAPDTRRSTAALRALVEAAAETLLSPTRQGVERLRPAEIGLREAEGEALAQSLKRARYIPAAVPLDAVVATQQSFLLPILRDGKPPAVAAREARPAIELASRPPPAARRSA